MRSDRLRSTWPATGEDRARGLRITHERRRLRICCGTTAEGLRCTREVWQESGLFCAHHNPARPRAVGAHAAAAFHRLYTEVGIPPEFYAALEAAGLDFKLITWTMRLQAVEGWFYARDFDDWGSWVEETARLRDRQEQRLASYVAQARRGRPGAGRMGQLAWFLVHNELHPRAGQKTRQRYMKPGEKAAAIAEEKARREAYLAKRKIERAAKARAKAAARKGSP